LSKLRAVETIPPNSELDIALKQLANLLPVLTQRLMGVELELKKVEAEENEKYPGSIKCSKIIFPGVDFSAGNLTMQRDHLNLEHCRLRIDNGDWVRGLA
jgi:hypothetical protein